MEPEEYTAIKMIKDIIKHRFFSISCANCHKIDMFYEDNEHYICLNCGNKVLKLGGN